VTVSPGDDAAAQLWRCDEAQWPVVVVGPPRLQVTRPPLGVQLDALFARRQRMALCLDIRHMPPLDVAARRRLVDWVQARAAETSVVAAVAAVITTPLQRGLITAVLWQVKPQMPTRVFYALDDASPWLQEQLSSG
jgi:hypothetical protein